MADERKFYKVCSTPVLGGGIFSSMRRVLPPAFIVQYFLNKWVYPSVEKTGLMVFDNYEDAYTFIHNNMWRSRFSIYECQVKNPRRIKEVAYFDFIPLFWKQKLSRKGMQGVNTYEAPNGSYRVDAVKLTKKVFTSD